MPVLYRKRIITAAVILAVLAAVALFILYEGDDPRLAEFKELPPQVEKLAPLAEAAGIAEPGRGWIYTVNYFAETLTDQREYLENLREKFPGTSMPPARSRTRLNLKGELHWLVLGPAGDKDERVIVKLTWRDNGSTFAADRDDALKSIGPGASRLSEVMNGRSVYLDITRGGAMVRRRAAPGTPPLARQALLLLAEMMDLHPPETLSTSWEKEQSDPLGLYRGKYIVSAQNDRLLDVYKTKTYTELFFGAGSAQRSRGVEEVSRDTKGNAAIRWEFRRGRAQSVQGRFDTDIEHAKARISYRVSYNASLKGDDKSKSVSRGEIKKQLAGLSDLHMGRVILGKRPGQKAPRVPRLSADAVASGMTRVMKRLGAIAVNKKNDGAVKTVYADAKILIEGNPAEARARIREVMNDVDVSPPKKYMLAMGMILNGGLEGQAFAADLLRAPSSTKDLQMAALLGMNSHTWLDDSALDALADAVSGKLDLAPKSADTSLLLAGALANKQRIAGDEAGARRLTGLLRNRLKRTDDPDKLALVLKGLAAAGDAGSADSVRPYLSHSRLDVRVAAAEALSRMRDTRALDLVFEAVQNERDPRARDRYVELIPGMSPIDHLMKRSAKFLKESRNHRLRRYVLTKLWLRDRKRTAELARGLQDDTDPGVRELARQYGGQ